MQTNKTYQCAIVGGGLAGLCLAIQLADRGISVALYEKNKYPFHKVCGEYISMESWDFVCELGLPLNELNLPRINSLGVSSENGYMLNAPLALGGFGISRFMLDNKLFELAKKKGVDVFDDCKVFDVKTLNENKYEIKTSKGDFVSKIMCGAYGKYSPAFVNDDKKHNTNYIGVKYHIKTTFPSDRIELHNFKDGYCGISKVDNDRYCLCYLSSSKNLKSNDNDIKKMEENVLHKNPFLKKYFTQSEFLFDEPLVISNIYFDKKSTYKESLFLLGDAAGSITPLCGNGMSMAMRASKILAHLLLDYYNNTISMQDLIKQYNIAWNENFNTRITAGYYLQNLFGKKRTTNFALKTLKKFPTLTQKIISLTHGKPF